MTVLNITPRETELAAQVDKLRRTVSIQEITIDAQKEEISALKAKLETHKAKGLSVDMIAEHGPDFVEEMKEI